MLLDELNKVTQKTDKVMIDYLSQNQDERFLDLITYQIKTGGKRLRPFLLVNFFLASGGKDENKSIFPAAALEIFHNYSLLIDDIIDKGEIRRGVDTSWKKYGKSMTMCVSSFYFSSIVDLLKGYHPKILEIFSKETKLVMEGEIIDILQERGEVRNEPFFKKHHYENIEFSDYFEMVEKKTAALFRASCMMGSFLGGGDKYLNISEEFGKELGIAYQIRDDVLDIFGNEEDFGKEIGKDIKERKGGNIVLLLASKKKPELTKLISRETIDEELVEEAMTIINKTNAKKEAELLYRKHADRALQLIESLPRTAAKENLKMIVDYLSKRKK